MGYYYKMSLFVLFMSLILNTSLVINNTSSMYSDDYLTHVRALFDDDDSDEDYNSDSDSDNDYDRECGIPNCDECSYNNTCYVCNSGFYLSETNAECIPCEDSNCYRCISSGLNTCTECNYNYILFGYSCVSSYDFPREHKVSKCEAYNINYKCILCANDCTLESNGKCNCKKSNNAVVITIVVIVVAVILAIVIFVLLYLKRKKRNKATTKTTPVQVVPIQEKYAKQYSLNNNACEAKPAIMDHNRGSNGDLICSYGIESDNKVLCCGYWEEAATMNILDFEGIPSPEKNDIKFFSQATNGAEIGIKSFEIQGNADRAFCRFRLKALTALTAGITYYATISNTSNMQGMLVGFHADSIIITEIVGNSVNVRPFKNILIDSEFIVEGFITCAKLTA